MVKKKYFSYAICLLFMGRMESASVEEPFALITVPKSGSHLIIKALHFLLDVPAIWHTHFPSKYCISPKEGFLYTHFCLSDMLEENYSYFPGLKKIVNIRDLRDVCLSMVHHICAGLWPGMTPEQRQEFKTWSLEDQLMFVIEYDYDVENIASFAPNSLQISMSQIALQLRKYFNNPSCLICRYEYLVGDQGGGSRELQMQELQNINVFLGLNAQTEQLARVAGLLYGNEIDPFGQGQMSRFRSTFHTGKIGKWKEVFTEEHKRAFKERLGDVLIELGYEKDYSW